MLVVTTNEIPGWEIQRVCGEVFGLTVRSRNAFSQLGAGFKSMFGGELQGMTRNLAESRNEVMGRMLEHARAKGGNAVIGMRFDTSEMGDVWTELCAYGTAVVAVPLTDAAKQTAAALGYGAPGGGQSPDPQQAFQPSSQPGYQSAYQPQPPQPPQPQQAQSPQAQQQPGQQSAPPQQQGQQPGQPYGQQPGQPQGQPYGQQPQQDQPPHPGYPQQ
jgi:uncharacterized protein YbjQ (UPF0145 family)